jgi:small subunit ribosomal protein S21
MTNVIIKIKRNEPIDKALRRLKRAMNEEGTLREFKERRYFKKPSDKKREKSGRARIRAKKDAQLAS